MFGKSGGRSEPAVRQNASRFGRTPVRPEGVSNPPQWIANHSCRARQIIKVTFRWPILFGKSGSRSETAGSTKRIAFWTHASAPQRSEVFGLAKYRITKRIAFWTHASAPRRGEQYATVDCESFLPGNPNLFPTFVFCHIPRYFFYHWCFWCEPRHAASCRIDNDLPARTIFAK